MASGSCVTVASRCMIKPATPLDPRKPATTMRFHPHILFVYKMRQPATPNDVQGHVNLLKGSLSSLVRHCNDADVEFIEASTSLRFSSVEKHDDKKKDLFENFFSRPEEFKRTDHDLPLLSIQVTKFPNGEAMVLSASCSHVEGDGTSLLNFFKSWSECARSLAKPQQEEFHLFDPYVKIKGLSCAYGGKVSIKLPELGVLSQHDFYVSSQLLVELKRIATNGGQVSCSNLEALLAHIWKHVALANNLKDSNEYGLSIISDSRQGCNLILPQGYSGNVIMRGFTKAKVEGLKNENRGGDIVKRVQNVFKSLRDEGFKIFSSEKEPTSEKPPFEGEPTRESPPSEGEPTSERLPFEGEPTSEQWISELEGTNEQPTSELELVQKSELELVPTSETDFKAPFLFKSGSHKFCFYDMEFGWGKPSCVRSPRIGGDGEAFLWVREETGGTIHVSLALNCSAMKRLKQDTSFLLKF